MTEHWHHATRKRIEAPEVDACIAEIVAVLRKHRMSLEHEDGHGGFIMYRNASDACIDFSAEWIGACAVEDAAP